MALMVTVPVAVASAVEVAIEVETAVGESCTDDGHIDSDIIEEAIPEHAWGGLRICPIIFSEEINYTALYQSQQGSVI